MKKIFTLLSVTLITFAAIAVGPRPGSMLTIQSQGRGGLKVIVDGRRFEPYDNFMRLQGLTPGDHNIKIFQEKSNGFFGYFGRHYEVVYNTTICMRPFTALNLVVDRFGRVNKTETRFGGFYGRDGRYGDRDGRGGYDRGNNNWGNDYNKGHDFNFDQDGRQGDFGWDNGRNGGRIDDGRRDDGRNGGRVDDGRRNGAREEDQYYDSRMGSAMSDREFSGVMESISKEWFETNKIKSATQVINNNFFTAAQVKQLVLLFSFENNKLDVAKQAYSHTIDKNNYYTIKDALTFNSSKDELEQYMRTTR